MYPGKIRGGSSYTLGSSVTTGKTFGSCWEANTGTPQMKNATAVRTSFLVIIVTILLRRLGCRPLQPSSPAYQKIPVGAAPVRPGHFANPGFLPAGGGRTS